MKCKQVCHYICDNLDADIDSPRCRQIKRHLEACPDCAAYLDSLKKTVLLYKNLSAPTVPLSVHKRLFKAINVVWAIPTTTRTHAAKGKAH
jgi:anti-sigma factor RsiW